MNYFFFSHPIIVLIYTFMAHLTLMFCILKWCKWPIFNTNRLAAVYNFIPHKATKAPSWFHSMGYISSLESQVRSLSLTWKLFVWTCPIYVNKMHTRVQHWSIKRVNRAPTHPQTLLPNKTPGCEHQNSYFHPQIANTWLGSKWIAIFSFKIQLAWLSGSIAGSPGLPQEYCRYAQVKAMKLNLLSRKQSMITYFCRYLRYVQSLFQNWLHQVK